MGAGATASRIPAGPAATLLPRAGSIAAAAGTHDPGHSTGIVSGRSPVLLVPGYGAPSFVTDRAGRLLRSHGLDTLSIRLPWLAMGNILRSAEVVADQAERAMELHGHERVNILGNSIGGIVARYYLQEMEGFRFLDRGAFLSCPHSGTRFGYPGSFSPAGRQVRTQSPLIERLNHPESLECIKGRCLSLYVRWDGVILPSSSSYLPWGFNVACNRPLGHWRSITSTMMFDFAAGYFLEGLPPGLMPGHELGMFEAGNIFGVSLALRESFRFWRAFSRPFKAIGRRLSSLFRR